LDWYLTVFYRRTCRSGLLCHSRHC
jgi:hypothetical protein